jgi:hypothetical protein
MASRAPWLGQIVGTLAVITLAAPVMAQEKKYTQMVVRYVDRQDDGKVRHLGKPVMVFRVEPLEGKGLLELIVPNKGMEDMRNDKFDPIPQVAETVRDLKRGDVIKIELDHSKPKPYVRYAKRYKLKPGETDPKAYIFENTFRKGEGRSTYTAVVLSKYDEQATVAVNQKRDKEGDMVSDTAILEVLQSLKTGDLVEAEIRDVGRTPILTALERYAPPQKGKFLKPAESEVEGQKAPAVELEREGKTITALLPGKLQGKRWTPDPKVHAEVRKLKPDTEVVFRARDEGGKVWLKDIEPAPAPKKEKVDGSASAARGGRGDDEKRGRKADMDKADKDDDK